MVKIEYQGEILLYYTNKEYDIRTHNIYKIFDSHSQTKSQIWENQVIYDKNEIEKTYKTQLVTYTKQTIFNPRNFSKKYTNQMKHKKNKKIYIIFYIVPYTFFIFRINYYSF